MRRPAKNLADQKPVDIPVDVAANRLLVEFVEENGFRDRLRDLVKKGPSIALTRTLDTISKLVDEIKEDLLKLSENSFSKVNDEAQTVDLDSETEKADPPEIAAFKRMLREANQKERSLAREIEILTFADSCVDTFTLNQMIEHLERSVFAGAKRNVIVTQLSRLRVDKKFIEHAEAEARYRLTPKGREALRKYSVVYPELFVPKDEQ